MISRFKKVFILAPHTDDGELGAGGTIAKLLEQGADVYYFAFSTAEESVPKGHPKDVLRTEVVNATTKLGIKKEDLKFLDENNISLFLGPGIHLATYAVSVKNEMNLIAIIRKNLDKKILNDKIFFNGKDNIKKIINESSIQTNNDLKNLFNNVKDLKCFPTFTSDKIRQSDQKNIFFLGDALYASLPTFAQGTSQSIESAYELFNTLNEDNENSFNKYYIKRTRRLKMINRRSKLNYFIFHLSNPIFVLIRNIVLKIVVNNKSFLNKYLGQIYFKNNS